MKPAKCPNCGANITIDENSDAGICEFCNTPFVTEKALSQITNTSNNAHTIINNYYTNTPNQSQKNNILQDNEPRPTINVGLAILLFFFFYIIPGIIYIGVVKNKQEEWDEKHNNSN